MSLFPKILFSPRGSTEIYEFLGEKKEGKIGFLLLPFPGEKDSFWRTFPEGIIYPQSYKKVLPNSYKKVVAKVSNIEFSPSFEEWKELVKRAQESFITGSEKIVLARKTKVTLSERIDPFPLYLEMLSPLTYNFYIETASNELFMGASPERLYARKGKQLFFEAVAGTREKPKSEEKREEVKKELLHDFKEKKEFSHVFNYIEKKLSSYSLPFTSSCLKILETPALFHLYRTIESNGAAIDDLTLIRSLHPTPAVLGENPKSSLAFLEKSEPFRRGLYAGALGVIGREEVDISVAIRSLTIRDREINLFSGTGIVQESVAEREWQELNQKIQQVFDVLGIDQSFK